MEHGFENQFTSVAGRGRDVAARYVREVQAHCKARRLCLALVLADVEAALYSVRRELVFRASSSREFASELRLLG